ncbi:MAG: signal peptidase I [bacterium]|nr:signal peptidase I [bacterium]
MINREAVLSVILGAAILLTGWGLVNRMSWWPWLLVSVNSGSMRPSLNTGDLAVIDKRAKVGKGKVILFRKRRRFVLHRLIDQQGDMLVTKGDANSSADLFRVKKSDVIGVLLVRIPKLGYLSLVGKFRQTAWYVWFGILIAMIGLWLFYEEKN